MAEMQQEHSLLKNIHSMLNFLRKFFENQQLIAEQMLTQVIIENYFKELLYLEEMSLRPVLGFLK